MANGNDIAQPVSEEVGSNRSTAAPRNNGARYSWIERFLLFLSKTDLHVLQFCTPETRMTQVSLGVMVLITGILAYVSSYFAINSSFFGRSTSFIGLAIPAIVSFFYASAIIFFDREIVAATSKAAAIPRFFLAILIGIVIAFPIKMKLLEGRIVAEIVSMVEERNAGKIDKKEDLILAVGKAREMERERRLLPFSRNVESMEVHVSEQEDIRNRRLESYASEVEKLAEFVALAQDEYDRERNRVTCGDKCQQRLEELKAAREGYDSAQKSLKETQKLLDLNVAEAREQLSQAYKIMNDERKIIEQELAEIFADKYGEIAALQKVVDNEIANSGDFLSQYLALERIKDRDPASKILSIFLILFFIILEIFPVIIKLFIPYSEYNAYLDSRRCLNQNRLITITNFTLDQIAAHPEHAHINEKEITDIFEQVLEDPSIEVEMERNMRNGG